MKNKTGRTLLEYYYGKGCFMERAGIREITKKQEKVIKKRIRGFKKLDRTITYHHLQKKENGGEVTVENGANIAAYNHEWLNRQPPEIQEEINNKLREFKLKVDCIQMNFKEKDVEVEKVGRIEVSNDEDEYMVIPAYDNVEEYGKKDKFNRNKSKLDTKRLIDDYYNEI